MVAADHDRGFQRAIGNHFVECQSGLVSFIVSKPANAGWQALEGDLLFGHLQPAVQVLIFREELHQLFISLVNIFRVTRKRHPAEGPLAFAEERANISRNKAGEVEGFLNALVISPLANIVAVIKSDRARFLHADHRLNMFCHGLQRKFDVFLRVGLAQLIRRGQAHAAGHIRERIVG